MMNYENITLKQYTNIHSVLENKELDDLQKNIEILKIISGKDYGKEDIKVFLDEVKKLKFLNEKIPTKSVQRSYIINGRKYRLQTDIKNLTVNQYMDYSNYLNMGKSKTEIIPKLISIILIPQSAEYYNDGTYSVGDVIKDIEDINVIDANSIAFFLSNQLRVYNVHFLYCLILKMWWKKVMKKITTQEYQTIKTHCKNLASLIILQMQYN